MTKGGIKLRVLGGGVYPRLSLKVIACILVRQAEKKSWQCDPRDRD